MSSEGRKFIGVLLAAVLLALSAGCDNGHAPGDDHGHDAADEEARKGPHGGRLLEDGDFALEVTMFERGVPPEFHIYPLRNGKPVNPAEVQLGMELSRLGGRVDRIAFESQEDFLRSTQSIAEPHSWTVKATAQVGGKTHVWTYESFEGRTTISPEMASGAGVETAVAGPGRIEEQLSLFGSIQPDPNRIRNVSARFPGVIRSVHVNVGDRVKQGQQLAAIESNESLQVYALTAPITGVIVERHANVGETTDGDALFQVADFSSVRADLNAFPRDRSRLRRGQPVRVMAAAGGQEATASVDFIAPAGTGGNQSLLVRVQLDNADGQWTPGEFVEGLITVSAVEAPMVIPRSALQTFRDWEVVFVKVGDVYEFRPLELGRTDGERVEVLSGLQAGDTYVSGNSYLIKADIEKSGASHDH
ncbi:MAG: efflux RND transporter periplasmic adaptor subunit [Gammaproteobacteria bacterium]